MTGDKIWMLEDEDAPINIPDGKSTQLNIIADADRAFSFVKHGLRVHWKQLFSHVCSHLHFLAVDVAHLFLSCNRNCCKYKINVVFCEIAFTEKNTHGFPINRVSVLPVI